MVEGGPVRDTSAALPVLRALAATPLTGARALGTAAAMLDGSLKTVPAWPVEEIRAWCDEVRAVLHNCVRQQRPGTYEVLLIEFDELVLSPLLKRDVALFVVDGSPRCVLLFQLLGLLRVTGIMALRVCEADDCDRLFVKIGKGTHCSTRCYNRKYMRDLRAKERSQETEFKRQEKSHGKKTRTR